MKTMPRRSTAECGSYAAYVRHKRRGETPCEACYEAAAAYMREYREMRRKGLI